MTLDIAGAIGIIGAVSGLVWLILQLKLSPIEKNLDMIMKKMGSIKSEDELKRIMQIEIMKHEKECRQQHLSETGSIRVMAEDRN